MAYYNGCYFPAVTLAGAEMTSIAGILKGETSFGKPIRSGGAAYIRVKNDSSHIIALAEERSSRKKYAGGFQASLGDVLKSANSGLEELDFIAVSSCCEPARDILKGLPDLGPAELVPVGHHESHATLAFLGSGYDDALVVVSDGGGDVLGSYPGDDRRWWLHPREQLTFWHGSRSAGEAPAARLRRTVRDWVRGILPCGPLFPRMAWVTARVEGYGAGRVWAAFQRVACRLRAQPRREAQVS